MGIRSSSTVVAASAALVLASAAGAAWPAPFFQIDRAGLIDAEHTLGDGSVSSSQSFMNASSRLTGTSLRSDGGTTSVWTWAPGEGTTRIGFWDAEHTSVFGERNSTVNWLSNSGVVAGSSFRYDGGAGNGYTAWAWSGATGTVNVGMVDAAHTGSGNFRSSTISKVNSGGVVVGMSDRFDTGGATNGISAWAWTAGGGHVTLGLSSPEHSSPSGVRSSILVGDRLNDAGVAIGLSNRYAGETQAGFSAWAWSAGNGHTQLGLVDADHTDVGGERRSLAIGLSATSRVYGTSERFVGGLEPSTQQTGQSAWTWTSGVGQQRIGLLDAAHTGTSGRQISTPNGFIGGEGVVGMSTRYTGDTSNGQSAWVWTPGAGSQRIGLIDAAHTRVGDGYQDSSPIGGTTNAARVAGSAVRYSATGAVQGNSAWTWSASGGTQRIGLIDALHTGSGGFQINTPNVVSGAGTVVGAAVRYSGTGASVGQSIWSWTPVTGNTSRIGLFDTDHTATSGSEFQRSELISVNEAGQVIGTSTRFRNNQGRGLSGWFYDPATNVTSALVFSTGLLGRAATTPTILTDTGLVLGSYGKFATPSSSSPASTNAFLWSFTNGFTDLGALVENGLTAEGWRLLSSVVSANELNAIAGHGFFEGDVAGSQAVYVLTVPAPGAAGMMSIAGLLTMRRRRR